MPVVDQNGDKNNQRTVRVRGYFRVGGGCLEGQTSAAMHYRIITIQGIPIQECTFTFGSH